MEFKTSLRGDFIGDTMTSEKLRHAIELIKNGDKKGGQNLLVDVVNTDPNNETAWLWLSSVVPQEKRIFCLEKALSINPHNIQARNQLEKFKSSGQVQSTIATQQTKEKINEETKSKAPSFHTPLAKFRANFLRLVWLSLLFLILPVFFVVSGAVDVRRDWLALIPLVILPVGISIYRIYLLMMNFDLEILLYDDGFSYSKNGETRRYSWREIDKVWTTKYELISIIYIKYIKVKILDTYGKTLILDRTLRNVEKLEAIIQEQVAREKFPQAITMLQQGKQLEFGGATITKDYIKNEHDTIRWGELGNIQAWQGTLRLWKKGKQAISIMIGIPTTPNFALLVFLINYLNENSQTSSLLSQDMANEKSVPDEPDTSAKPKTGIRMKPGGNTDARLSGLFLLLLGAGAGYWQVFLPIKKALQQEPNISYSTGIAIVASIAVFMGLFLLVFGAEGLGFLSKPSSKIGLVLFFIGIIVFVLGCYFGMQFIMRGLGYY
jgi:hypothetical protein